HVSDSLPDLPLVPPRPSSELAMAARTLPPGNFPGCVMTVRACRPVMTDFRFVYDRCKKSFGFHPRPWRGGAVSGLRRPDHGAEQDRKSTRLNSSHVSNSYVVF